MGFFKKLKERLFTLNYDVAPETKSKKRPLVKNLTEDKTNNDKNLSVDKKAIKKQLKAEKKQRKFIAKKAKTQKYAVGLQKSSATFGDRLKRLQTKYQVINEDYFEELEEILLMADVGVSMTIGLINEIKVESKKEGVVSPKLINEIMVDKMFSLYVGDEFLETSLNIEPNQLNVFLVTGVNGVGKTTTIAKLAHLLKKQNLKIMIAAADTFRAGAVDQLEIWSQRVGVPIVKPKKMYQDPASVVFEAITKAKEENIDVLIIDTAGRLQNKVNLMKELAKISRIIDKVAPKSLQESILVIDATTGQNGIAQAVEFQSITNITSIILTKLDGTSKGGIVIAIKEKLNIPVKYVGLGERLDDLIEFDLDNFIYGLTRELVNNEKEY